MSIGDFDESRGNEGRGVGEVRRIKGKESSEIEEK